MVALGLALVVAAVGVGGVAAGFVGVFAVMVAVALAVMAAVALGLGLWHVVVFALAIGRILRCGVYLRRPWPCSSSRFLSPSPLAPDTRLEPPSARGDCNGGGLVRDVQDVAVKPINRAIVPRREAINRRQSGIRPRLIIGLQRVHTEQAVRPGFADRIARKFKRAL